MAEVVGEAFHPVTRSLAFSPCPNDTFMFHALVHGDVGPVDTGFRVTLADV